MKTLSILLIVGFATLAVLARQPSDELTKKVQKKLEQRIVKELSKEVVKKLEKGAETDDEDLDDEILDLQFYEDAKPLLFRSISRGISSLFSRRRRGIGF
uniref:Uncharacterized protein n=1 Tax=Clytia hemisphaerica TaxID=252671 RepID=A0A7M5UZ95_9CNID